MRINIVEINSTVDFLSNINWDALSAVATSVGTLFALFFSLRKPKPTVDLDYVLHTIDKEVEYFKITFINTSTINTAIRIRGVSANKSDAPGLHTDDGVEFKYYELSAGAVEEFDITATYRRILNDQDKMYVNFDIGSKVNNRRKVKFHDNNKEH